MIIAKGTYTVTKNDVEERIASDIRVGDILVSSSGDLEFGLVYLIERQGTKIDIHIFSSFVCNEIYRFDAASSLDMVRRDLKERSYLYNSFADMLESLKQSIKTCESTLASMLKETK